MLKKLNVKSNVKLIIMRFTDVFMKTLQKHLERIFILF